MQVDLEFRDDAIVDVFEDGAVGFEEQEELAKMVLVDAFKATSVFWTEEDLHEQCCFFFKRVHMRSLPELAANETERVLDTVGAKQARDIEMDELAGRRVHDL